MAHFNHAPSHEEESKPCLRRIAVVGNYVPRQCGIATFTTDLCRATASVHPQATCVAVPINDTPEGYSYPPRVRFEISQHDLVSYRQAADFLNIINIDVVCLQHEYGIFGGPAGSHILALLRELRMPVVTTLHTILREPDKNQRRVMEGLAEFSDRLVAMSERGAEFLREVYCIPPNKIDVIPHGIPDVPFVDPNFYKDKFGVEGKTVLLTFGLLSPNKGIENVIEALPAVLERQPNLVYIVLGVTHPHVRKWDGESYRFSLQRLAVARGVDDHVLFHNRFVSLEELVEFIGAADIYTTPYLNEAQIVSGTLAYAIGAGKAVISSPYWYAQELLADGRGVLVPFGDPKALAQAVLDLLGNEAGRHAMRKRAYLLGREMVWEAVAARYVESFERARQARHERPRPALPVKPLLERSRELPPLDLQHLRRITDDTGLLQHATISVPSYLDGYTTDDNARALLLTVLLDESGQMPSAARELGSRYLAFLLYGFNAKSGRFRNVMSYERQWLDESGSEDCHGRSLWGLGAVLGRSSDRGLRAAAGQLFQRALPAILDVTSRRAEAFALLGICDYLKRFSGDRGAQDALRTLGERLENALQEHGSIGWCWFEDVLTYCNAALPHALLRCGQTLERTPMTESALKALDWLADLQRSEEGHFVPIGSDGFYPRGGRRARFDQQPVEARAMVAACLEAFRVTGEERWRTEARRAFEWFLGRNDLRLALYDPATGACRDGLHADRPNENRGAESTLAFLHSLMEMRLMENVIDVADKVEQPA